MIFLKNGEIHYKTAGERRTTELVKVNQQNPSTDGEVVDKTGNTRMEEVRQKVRESDVDIRTVCLLSVCVTRHRAAPTEMANAVNVPSL